MQNIEQLKRESAERMQKKAQALEEKLNKINHKIAVYSGKGGVGKTTVAVNLAVALAKRGHKVGFLDADIDCPNANVLFGIKEKTKIVDGAVIPIEKYGVKVLSMAFLVEGDAAIMWRGPMLTKAINDLLLLGDWGELDYLIIDMPPGTSDSPITVMQLLKLDGFIAVTTPQELAVADMNRSINMIENFGKHVLGIVENMCSDVFGCSRDENYLAHIPLDAAIVKSGDSGLPIVLSDKKMLALFENMIEKLTAK